MQLIRGKSIYGFHLEDQHFIRIALYNPIDVVTVAREIANGKLPTPEDASQTFPAMLCYEHKYNYKLKFLTDYKVNVFGFTTITNMRVHSLVHSDFLLASIPHQPSEFFFPFIIPFESNSS